MTLAHHYGAGSGEGVPARGLRESSGANGYFDSAGPTLTKVFTAFCRAVSTQVVARCGCRGSCRDDAGRPCRCASRLTISGRRTRGFQQLNQYQQNWISYRSTSKAVKQEKFLFLGAAGPYAGARDGRVLHADRIEGLVSQGHAKWVSARQESVEPTRRQP
jgi:hypothetical protein